MFHLIKVNRAKILLLMLLCNAFLICCLFVRKELYQGKVTATAGMQTSGKDEKSDQLLVNTYLTRIMEASNDFYDEYYTISPEVNYYSVSVKEISAIERVSYVTFTSNPYLGAHNSVGIDEITFSADYFGNVKLENFNHIVSYHLPDHLKSLEKKRVPGKYYEEDN